MFVFTIFIDFNENFWIYDACEYFAHFDTNMDFYYFDI